MEHMPVFKAQIRTANTNQICFEPTCLTESHKDSIFSYCLLIELKNTEFSNCLSKIKDEKPDLSSKYDCLGPVDYKNAYFQLEIYKSKRDCWKIILIGECGNGAIDNFEQNIALAVKIAQLTKMWKD
ncbi:unnamed protein product [Caenorhabditis brenneri]